MMPVNEKHVSEAQMAGYDKVLNCFQSNKYLSVEISIKTNI